MIENPIIQADLLADLLAYSTLTAIIASAKEVREDQYQGVKFAYPAVRLALVQQKPIIETEQCDLARLSVVVRCYSEGASSKESDHIAGVVNRRWHRRNFHGTGWYTWLRSEGLVGAIRVSERLWRAEAMFGGVVYPRTVQVTP